MEQQTQKTQELPLDTKLGVYVTSDALRRIRVRAAKDGTSPGRVISDLAGEHLSPVEE